MTRINFEKIEIQFYSNDKHKYFVQILNERIELTLEKKKHPKMMI